MPSRTSMCRHRCIGPDLQTKTVRFAALVSRHPLRTDRKEQPMLDVIFLVGGVGFFAVAIAYAYACDHL